MFEQIKLLKLNNCRNYLNDPRRNKKDVQFYYIHVLSSCGHYNKFLAIYTILSACIKCQFIHNNTVLLCRSQQMSTYEIDTYPFRFR